MYRILKLNFDQRFSGRKNPESLLIEKDVQISLVSTFYIRVLFLQKHYF